MVGEKGDVLLQAPAGGVGREALLPEEVPQPGKGFPGVRVEGAGRQEHMAVGG